MLRSSFQGIDEANLAAVEAWAKFGGFLYEAPGFEGELRWTRVLADVPDAALEAMRAASARYAVPERYVDLCRRLEANGLTGAAMLALRREQAAVRDAYWRREERR